MSYGCGLMRGSCDSRRGVPTLRLEAAVGDVENVFCVLRSVIVAERPSSSGCLLTSKPVDHAISLLVDCLQKDAKKYPPAGPISFWARNLPPHMLPQVLQSSSTSEILLLIHLCSAMAPEPPSYSRLSKKEPRRSQDDQSVRG